MSKILFTGASGFLGSYITKAFQSSENELIKVGITDDSHILSDISKEIPNLGDLQVDMLVHIAGKAHVIPKTEAEKKSFYDVNYEGTKNIVKALKFNPKSIVFISTVAVYGVETGENIKESDPLLGNTPYADSKIKAENFLIEHCKTHKINLVILRLPLISGGNPPGNLGDMIKAIKKGYYFRIGNGEARRSIVAASDIAELIPKLMDKNGVYNLTDNIHPTFKEIDSHIGLKYGIKIKTLPKWFLKIFAIIGDYIPKFPINSLKFSKMTKSLTFSSEKATRELGWNPKNSLSEI